MMDTSVMSSVGSLNSAVLHVPEPGFLCTFWLDDTQEWHLGAL